MKTRLGFAIYLVLILLAGGAIAIPSISDHSPASDLTSTVGDSQDFSVNINETADVTWFLNGTLVNTDEAVTTSTYSNDDASAGVYNVTAVTQNANGTDQYIWIWTVNSTPLTITGYNPDDTTPESITGESVNFDVTLNQEAEIRWLINGTEVDTATGASDSYSNSTALAGRHNVTAVASNMNGTEQRTWDWTVTNATNETLSITDFRPTDTTPESTTGTPIEFNITLNQEAEIRWLINGTVVDTATGTSDLYTNSTAVPGTYNVTAAASNANGSAQQIWGWTVTSATNETLSITDFTPTDTTPESITGTSMEFNVTLNQEAEIRWLINGTVVDTTAGTSDSYSNSTAVPGTYNVTAAVSNANGSAQQIWDWKVSNAEIGSPEITGFTPEEDPASVVGAYQNFTVETNQDVDIEWYIDGDLEQTNESVSFAALNVSDKATGSYNVTAIASNENGDAQKRWTWTVASKTYLSGDRIWDADANQSLDYTWTALSYSGFYYDLDTGEGSETMTVHLDSRSDRSIDREDLEYETTPITTDFEYGNWGKYQVIGFMAEKYFAGYLDTTRFTDEISVMSDGILSKVLLDESDKKSLYAGSSLTLEQGYALNIVEVDVNGNNVYVTLSKDGSQVDETIVRDNGTYVYEAEMGDSNDVPIIAVHFGNVFLGTEASAVFIDAIFQISDEYISVDSGDSYGVMEVQTVSNEKITMQNDDSISLNKGKVTNIMGKLEFIVADDSTLRFAPFVDMSETGTYELRGTVSEEEAFEWTPLNFEGFYYNIDEGIGTEKLEITELSGRTIDDGNLVYTSTPEDVSFEYDDWGDFEVIGFMADKYFAGYPKNDFTNEVSLVSQGQLSKVLLDKSDKTSLVSGSSLVLEEGYALSIVEVDVNGDTVYIRLTKDGDQIDDDIISSDATYAYKMNVGDVDDVPVIAVHFQDVFQGTESSAVFVDGIFQISDEYVSVESGEAFGEMEVTGISETGITMENEDSISLSRDKEVSVMGDIKFKVADDSTVRFYPFVEVETAASEALIIDNNEVVTQGVPMNITVTSRGMAVGNATLKLDSENIGSTSNEGTLRYTPDQTGNFTITAEKDGYASATSNLEVISSQDESRKMTIDIIPEEVFEGTTVEFRVLKAIGGEAIEGAEVAFDGRPIGNTSSNGNITHTVTEVGIHKLTVSKPGLLDAELNFEVKELAARFTFTNLQISPLEVRAGDEATFSVDVSNTGTAPGNYTVELKINGTVADSQAVTLNNGNSTTLKFVHVEEEPGTYIASVRELNSTYEVLEKSGTIWYILGGIILLAAAGVGYLFTAGGWTVEMAKAKINEFIGSIR
ncbi:S-layer-related duplication domain protein [Methanomethylovorans hollandica DSM 15978]|uniref:S-layer-related duplication domain protein n=1 Tax=Methanomethylovorans hollandica (strain DSM 15978 / NBRC 107637 / DMS1) TaxID=867904 RepID=L0L1Y2_METHD|nr:S-layer protein domain-containing protein [Methanomethylovorans hollandica]AGB50279.1 S-layer-related duplication domain protein [Methanomethylovorans hollandica DSM 15978]